MADPKPRKLEEFGNKFKSKEDLHRYMTQHGNRDEFFNASDVENVFLPSLKGTPLAFLRDILAGKKKVFKCNDIATREIPRYPEISVKALYDDALTVPELALYLPSKEYMKKRLPERTFFFGILST
jgi:hypothetical protein